MCQLPKMIIRKIIINYNICKDEVSWYLTIALGALLHKILDITME